MEELKDTLRSAKATYPELAYAELLVFVDEGTISVMDLYDAEFEVISDTGWGSSDMDDMGLLEPYLVENPYTSARTIDVTKVLAL